MYSVYIDNGSGLLQIHGGGKNLAAAKIEEEISELDGIRENKEHFIRAIRKFMQMDTLTAPLLRELIERIDVYEVKGTGKNRTQQLLIHYKFVGCIDIPEVPNRSNFTQEIRKGVAVAYIPKQLTA